MKWLKNIPILVKHFLVCVITETWIHLTWTWWKKVVFSTLGGESKRILLILSKSILPMFFLCLSFNQVPLVYFRFYFHHSRRWVIEDLALIYVIECSAYNFFWEFLVSGLTVRPLTRFAFIFVCGVECSDSFFGLWLSSLPRAAHPGGCPFSTVCSCVWCYGYGGHRLRVYPWASCPVPMGCVSVFVSVLCLDDCSFVV